MATSADENQALVQAVGVSTANICDCRTVREIPGRLSSIGWRPSALANLGVLYLQTGRPGKALQVVGCRMAGDEARHAADESRRCRLRARATGCSSPCTWAGCRRVDRAAWRDRRTRCRRTSRLTCPHGARSACGSFNTIMSWQQDQGPMALNSILRIETSGDYTPPAGLEKYHAVPAGASLTEMQALAVRVGLRLQMAHASSEVRVPVPSMVHFKTDHFTADPRRTRQSVPPSRRASSAATHGSRATRCLRNRADTFS